MDRKVGIVLVTYYLRELSAAIELAHDFCDAAGLMCEYVIVVDNAGDMTCSTARLAQKHILVTGENRFWEFSGWVRGLAEIKRQSFIFSIVLLNDSFARNWSISPISRYYLKQMYTKSQDGYVSAWKDNFSHFKPPIFSRRPNSRVVFLPASTIDLVAGSIKSAIHHMEMMLDNQVSLFSNEEQARINDWIHSQLGRWTTKTLPSRSKRIFLEHHMFDALPPRLVKWFPETYLGSIAYSVVRRIFMERR